MPDDRLTPPPPAEPAAYAARAAFVEDDADEWAIEVWEEPIEA